MKCKCLCALGVFALSVAVYAGPRPVATAQHGDVIGISKISEAQPVPQGLRGNVELQPVGYPVPEHLWLSREELNRGQASFDASAEAMVYRNSRDSGFGIFHKYSDGHFVGNLLHLGNGFPLGGGEVNGYDLLIYNSASNPEDPDNSTGGIIVSLWTGDPLGFIDTRVQDPPAPIAGTECTFDLPQTGLSGSQGCVDTTGDGLGDTCIGGWSAGLECADDDTDCGLCEAVTGDDIAECPGLYRFTCNFADKVMLPSRNVWMIMEYTGGCRMGWRFSYFFGPEIAAVGEENFCANTCPAAPVPCVDLMIELVEGAAADGLGVGTCCEDPGIVCDHSDGTLECGHATTCGTHVADAFDGWCYGAPNYFAAFITTIYANTDTTVSLVPRSMAPDAKPGTALFDVRVAGWDADGDTVPSVKVWQTQIDSGTYVSDLRGELTNSRGTSCLINEDCPNGLEGEQCEGESIGNCIALVCSGGSADGAACATSDDCPDIPGTCAGAWQDCGAYDWPDNPNEYDLCLNLPACDVSANNPRCGSTTVFDPPVNDNGFDYYAMSLRLDASADFKGCATVSFLPDPATFLKDAASAGIPLVGYVPGQYCVETGQCCDMSVPYPFVCLSDEVTANECAALGQTKFDATKTCGEPCGCETNSQCDDGDACTDDACVDSVCVSTDNFPAGTCCDVGTGATCDIDDLDQCTDDYCAAAGNRGDCMHDVVEGLACDDGQDCDTVNDLCLADGTCVGTPIFDFPCTADADCEAIDPAASCSTALGNCICQLPEITCDIHGSEKANPMCLDAGEKYLVDVLFRFTPQVVNGAQFSVNYDPSCLDFVSIGPGGDPFVFELEEDVDEAAGYIFYAVGVDPFGGAGVSGSAVLATISFIKIGDCNDCTINLSAGDNPADTIMVDNTGQPVEVIPVPCGPVYANSDPQLDIPDSSMTNVDCDANTAVVSWDPPVSWSDCEDMTLVCAGSHESGYVYPMDVVMNGGELPIGISTFCCTATDAFCGDGLDDCWTVEVNDQTSFEVTLQLSPIMAGDVERCIDFDLYADCVQAPFNFSAELFFGGLWDHVGHFTEVMKIPSAGQWVCITAKDQLHTLRASAMLACVDGAYEAVFKGDPFFGGNWLTQGNLDGWKKDNPLASHDVIDILDFGQFVANYMAQVDPNTDCETVYAGHADINGDGVVDGLDFSFIMENFLAHSKNACCPDAAATTTGLTSVTVRELRQMGMGDLAVADLNSDGVVDSVDITAFMNGSRPIQKAPIRDAGSRLGTR